MAEYTHINSEDELAGIELPVPEDGQVSLTIVTDAFTESDHFKPTDLENETNLRVIVHPSGERGGGGDSLAWILNQVTSYAFTFVVRIGRGALEGIGAAAGKQVYGYVSDKLAKALAEHYSESEYHFQRTDIALTLTVVAPAKMSPANTRELVGLAFDFMRDPGNTTYRKAVYDPVHGALVTMYEH